MMVSSPPYHVLASVFLSSLPRPAHNTNIIFIIIIIMLSLKISLLTVSLMAIFLSQANQVNSSPQLFQKRSAQGEIFTEFAY